LRADRAELQVPAAKQGPYAVKSTPRRRHQQAAAEFIVSGNAIVSGSAIVSGAAIVNATVSGSDIGNAYVFRAAKTRGRAQYGHRRSVCLQEWALHAIIAMYPNAPPKITRAHRRLRMAPINQAHLSERVPINQSHLYQRVIAYLEWLATQDHADARKYRNSGYAGKKPSWQTFRLALKALQEANH
jgi:hypothetical protein